MASVRHLVSLPARLHVRLAIKLVNKKSNCAHPVAVNTAGVSSNYCRIENKGVSENSEYQVVFGCAPRIEC